MKRKLFLTLLTLCVITAMLTFTACNQNNTAETTPATTAPTVSQATETAAPAATAAPTEAPAAQTDAPAEETAADQNDSGYSQVIEDDSVYKNELTDHQWILMKVYQDGQEISPATYYGSVLRQTGAYIEFKGDDTFSCVLGVKGCKGTYSIDTGVVILHISVLYDGTDEGKSVNEDVTLKWDRAAGLIDFDYFGVTNEFSKRSEG